MLNTRNNDKYPFGQCAKAYGKQHLVDVLLYIYILMSNGKALRQSDCCYHRIYSCHVLLTHPYK